jgi:hypothetical protein
MSRYFAFFIKEIDTASGQGIRRFKMLWEFLEQPMNFCAQVKNSCHSLSYCGIIAILVLSVASETRVIKKEDPVCVGIICPSDPVT